MTMQDPKQMLRDVVDRGIAALVAALPPARVSVTDPEDAPVIARARAATALIRSEWTKVQAALTSAGVDVPKIWFDTDFTAEARQGRARDLVASIRTQTLAGIDAIAAQVDKLGADLRAATLPPRPQPADAAQEAALANLKADLRMVLDPLSGSEVADALASLAKRYEAAGDTLGVWFLLATDWPSLYLQSRGEPDVMWTALLPQLISGRTNDPTATVALKLLAAVEGPKGVFGSMLGMKSLARTCLDELASYRPAA